MRPQFGKNSNNKSRLTRTTGAISSWLFKEEKRRPGPESSRRRFIQASPNKLSLQGGQPGGRQRQRKRGEGDGSDRSAGVDHMEGRKDCGLRGLTGRDGAIKRYFGNRAAIRVRSLHEAVSRGNGRAQLTDWIGSGPDASYYAFLHMERPNSFCV